MGQDKMPSRRNILKSIGAGTTVITASTLGSAVDDGIKIVTGARGDEPSTTRVVSEEWYDHVLAVREAQSELLTTARNNSAIRKGLSRANTDKSSNPLITDPISVKRVSTDEEIGGLHKRKLQVPAEDQEQVKKNTPNQIRGIPVEIVDKPYETKLDNHGEGSFCNSQVASCVQGGDIVSGYYADGGDSCSQTWATLSLTCGVTQDGKQRVMTSAHGFARDYCGPDINGMAAYQGNMCNDSQDPKFFGNVQDYNWGLDFATISTDYYTDNYNSSISSGVVDETVDIDGHVTEDGLDYLDSNNYEVEKYGARTCYDSGIVNGVVRQYTNCGSENTWVEVTTQAAGGDSGAPHYRKVDSYNNGYLELIGPHVRHDVNSNGSHEVSYCPAAFEISNQHDVVFNTSDCGY
jgi:hypothetical protein